MAVARQTQIIGASPHSWEDAVRNGLDWRALEVIGLCADDMSAIRWKNAGRIFPANSFPRCASG